MKTYKRVFCIVIDSVGCGECPDSYLYGDKGANTLKHLSYIIPQSFSYRLLNRSGYNYSAFLLIHPYCLL